MPPETFERRLTAILSADVSGYSRLMREDDDTTVRTFTGYRETMTVLIKEHEGRVVDSPGDNLLAEFSSVLNAVNCAIEIQRKLRERNAEFRKQMKADFDKRTEGFVYKAPFLDMIKEQVGLPDEMRHFGTVLQLKQDYVKTAEDDQLKPDSNK